MASRRLKSDRFLTDCFTAEYYTKAGLDWVNDNNMGTVLLRHYPELATALVGVDNAFQPWKESMAAKGTVPTNPGVVAAAPQPGNQPSNQ